MGRKSVQEEKAGVLVRAFLSPSMPGYFNMNIRRRCGVTNINVDRTMTAATAQRASSAYSGNDRGPWSSINGQVVLLYFAALLWWRRFAGGIRSFDGIKRNALYAADGDTLPPRLLLGWKRPWDRRACKLVALPSAGQAW